MQEINKATVTLPAHIGDVVIKNLLNTGVDVVVTANMK
jgi:CxxC motif-containing protein